MLVFCVAPRVVLTNNCNTRTCCERLASADVDRCTATKSECATRIQEEAPAYLPTYQNQNVGHKAKMMCMYTIDEQEISQILGFQRLSSSKKALYIPELITTCWRECCTEVSCETCIVFRFFSVEFAIITIISKMWDCPTFLFLTSQNVGQSHKK